MIIKTAPTFYARIYMSGPIEVAKQIIRNDVFHAGLCITIEPTTFIYTGGEEAGYVVGLINYPRFVAEPGAISERARCIAVKLLKGTFQHSALVMTPDETKWITSREESKEKGK